MGIGLREGESKSGGMAVPIIAATASAAVEDRLACFAAGANDFLLKPIDAKSFRAIVQSRLQHHAPPADNHLDLVGS